MTKLTPAQRKALDAMTDGEFTPVRGGRSSFPHAIAPATAIALHNLGLAEVTEDLRYRDGRERSVVIRVAITPAGRELVEQLREEGR